jgi:hypothetical protein
MMEKEEWGRHGDLCPIAIISAAGAKLSAEGARQTFRTPSVARK